jgi:tetratricopeptide (TPR) repeat protein
VRALFILLALSAPALAEDDPLTSARTHFEAGRALYRVGNYPDALREFQLGYKLSPRPLFLINIGQCHRKLDDLPRAREAYQRFLDEAPADAPERAQVRDLLADVDREIALRPPKPPPPPPTAEPPPAAVVVAPPPPPPEKKRSRAIHLAWIVPLGAVVITAAVLGGVLGSAPSRVGCGDPGVIGCVP